MELPNKKYNIIYADPPWSYRDKLSHGQRGSSYKYPVESLRWIENLPISTISEDNCALFLWVTMPKLHEIWDVISCWGFEYKTCAFSWVKRNKFSSEWFFGLGNYTRQNVELCLLATRGKLERKSKGVSSVVDSPIQAHSVKPDCVRDRIVDLFGDLPRIELFASKYVEGWDCWGLDVTYIHEETE